MTLAVRWLLFCSLALAFLASCKPNPRIIDSSAERVPESRPAGINPTPETTTVESEVAAMRTANFNFIYVFHRKDSAMLDADDRRFMNANTPYEINRKALADGGRALVVGSNFRFPAENFKLMKERFAFEDFSKPESEIMATNSNTRNK